MRLFQLKRLLTQITSLMLGLALVPASSAVANPQYSGTIVAEFSNPVFAGTYLDTAGRSVYADHSSTAVFSIINSGSTAELIFGDNNLGAGAPSEVIFFGSPFVNVAPDTDFVLGTLTYNNGTSTIPSLLFGATLTFSVLNAPSITPISVNIQLTTTGNGGFSPVLDADYLTFPSPVNLQLHVYEGAGATASVIGRIVGDPMLTVDLLTLSPDQVDNGFLRAVPEPSSLALSTIALGSIGFWRMRKKRKSIS